ncbi:hypothetical protein XJ76305_1030 [Enterococcus faecalis]|nr:hypothetical protein XJ76305_1030 [Enterococcus faecalis]
MIFKYYKNNSSNLFGIKKEAEEIGFFFIDCIIPLRHEP